jgi:hypothetical protein
MTRRIMLGLVVGMACALGSQVAPAATATAAATPKEAVGFAGTVTGTVKSARADGASFVLTVTTAEPDDKASGVKDGKPMAGKDLTLGTRMPRKDGVPHPSEEDVAYIKSLKVGTAVTVKVFAVRADPAVLRIQGPGRAADKADAGTREK